MKARLTIGVMAIAGAATLSAHGHGGVQLGIGIGVPLPYVPAPYYAPTPYEAPPVVVVPPRSGYTQQAPSNVYSTRPAGQPLYYYCAGAKGYYPYVRECPGGWEAVPAVPR